MKLPKSGVDDVAVDAHPSETGGDRDGLMRDDPHLVGPTGRFHRKAHRRIGGAHATRLKRENDAARDVIALIGRMMKFEVGGGTRGAADIFAIHPDDEGDERSSEGKGGENVVALIVERRLCQRDETNVVGAGLESDVADRLRVEVDGARRRGEAAMGCHCIYPFYECAKV